jgi:hypothetical protein
MKYFYIMLALLLTPIVLFRHHNCEFGLIRAIKGGNRTTSGCVGNNTLRTDGSFLIGKQSFVDGRNIRTGPCIWTIISASTT